MVKLIEVQVDESAARASASGRVTAEL